MSEPTGAGARGRGVWTQVMDTVRRVAGMPDYAAHLEHLRRCHPDRPVPTEREFFEQYLQGRYGDAPTRCC
jgi:uncharacterized short protein YbdD (DUF466 family)